MNTEKLVHFIIFKLRQAGFETILFGGWAKEFIGLIPPREHKDIDLLYLCDDFVLFDLFIENESDFKEIEGKHFEHKRAFYYKGIMIELLLVQTKGKSLYTSFWNKYILYWSQIGCLIIEKPGYQSIKVANKRTIEFYEKHNNLIDMARRTSLKQKTSISNSH